MSDQFSEYEDVIEWDRLIKHASFSKLTDKIKNDQKALQNEIDKLIASPSFDNAIKAASLGKAKEALNNLLLYFDFVQQKKSHLDKRNVERNTIVPNLK